LGRFVPKAGIHFEHFGLELGMVFEVTRGVYEPIYREKERKRNMRIGNGFEEFFVCALI